MTNLLLHDRGIVAVRGERIEGADLPEGWLTPTEFKGREEFRFTVRRLLSRLGTPRGKGHYRLFLFTDYFEFIPDIKRHMAPPAEEVRSLVRERMAKIYDLSPEEEVHVVYDYGIGGLFASAVASSVVQGLADALPGGVVVFSGTLAFPRLMVGILPPKEGGSAVFIYVEYGTSQGVSLYGKDVQMVARLPSLRSMSPKEELDEQAKRMKAADLGQELQELIPEGATPAFYFTGLWTEKLLVGLRFAAPYQVVPHGVLLSSGADIGHLLYLRRREAKRPSPLRGLLPGVLVGGLLAYGGIHYALLLQEKRSLERILAENAAISQQVKGYNARIEALQRELAALRSLEGNLEARPGPGSLLRRLSLVLAGVSAKGGIEEVSFQAKDGLLRLKVRLLSVPKEADYMAAVERGLAQVGFTDVEVSSYSLEGAGEGKQESYDIVVRLHAPPPSPQGAPGGPPAGERAPGEAGEAGAGGERP